jgi:hypothetical protein
MILSPVISSLSEVVLAFLRGEDVKDCADGVADGVNGSAATLL